MSVPSSSTSDATAAAAVQLQPHPERGDLLLCRVRVRDRDCIGREARLEIERVVHVKDERPVHGRTKLWQAEFRVTAEETELTVPRAALGHGYDYEGQQIDIRLESRVEIDDGIFFDTELRGVHRVGALDRPLVSGSAKELSEPSDAFDFLANFSVITPRAKAVTVALAVVGGVLILVNALVGLHDQLVPDPRTWLYTHVDGDGESRSPLVEALLGCGATGAVVWFAMRRQLRKYMTFKVVRPKRLTRETVVPAASLVRGKPRVGLRQATLRVVAYNREKGQYRRGSGTKERTVSFQTPARAVKLYQEHLLDVPAGAPLESRLTGEVPFRELFAALYPPLAVTSTHGIDVRWEVQLLHPEYVDQEVVIEAEDLAYREFLDA